MGSMTDRYPDLSVIVPTSRRSVDLGGCLASLRDQSIPRDRFEVIVVDDGSDATAHETCRELARAMPLRVFRSGERGRAHGKNLGVKAARAPISLFFDGRRVAHPDLLWQHVSAHRRDPRDRVAVLGYTGWAPHVSWTPLMYYLSRVGSAQHDQGGPSYERSVAFGSPRDGSLSYKTEFLRLHGAFDENFTDVLEDTELGYRLAKQGLTIKYHRGALSYLTEPETLLSACRLAEAQGAALVTLAMLHPDPQVLTSCKLHEKAWRWQDARNRARRLLRRARRLERSVDGADASSVSALSLYEAYDELLGVMGGRGVARALNQLPTSDLMTLERARQQLGTAIPGGSTLDRSILSVHE